MASRGIEIALGVSLLGLMIGLPNLNTMFIDFTQFGNTAITVMRFGLLIGGVYLVTGGNDGQ